MASEQKLDSPPAPVHDLVPFRQGPVCFVNFLGLLSGGGEPILLGPERTGRPVPRGGMPQSSADFQGGSTVNGSWRKGACGLRRTRRKLNSNAKYWHEGRVIVGDRLRLREYRRSINECNEGDGFDYMETER